MKGEIFKKEDKKQYLDSIVKQNLDDFLDFWQIYQERMLIKEEMKNENRNINFTIQ